MHFMSYANAWHESDDVFALYAQSVGRADRG